MSKNQKEIKIRLFEIRVSLAGIENQLSCVVEEEERSRFISVLEGEDAEPAFYGFNLGRGLECFLNLYRVTQVNVLDILAGVPAFDKAPKKPEAQEQKEFDERMELKDPVILRVWGAFDESIQLFSGVDYQDWLAISTALEVEENTPRFVGLDDEDGERVILSVSNISAIEMFDTHYLTDQEIEQYLKDE